MLKVYRYVLLGVLLAFASAMMVAPGAANAAKNKAGASNKGKKNKDHKGKGNNHKGKDHKNHKGNNHKGNSHKGKDHKVKGKNHKPKDHKAKGKSQNQKPANTAGLKHAESLLTQAKHSAEKDPLPEFGGHRAKGVHHIDHAHKHLHAAIKEAGKAGKGGKGGGSVAHAVKEMDHALQQFKVAIHKYDTHHKGPKRKTGLHHAEALVQQAKSAASSSH